MQYNNRLNYVKNFKEFYLLRFHFPIFVKKCRDKYKLVIFNIDLAINGKCINLLYILSNYKKT